MVEQDDEARDIVAGNLLQAQTETDTQRPAEHRKRGEVDADQGQDDQHREHDHQRLGQPREHLAQVVIEPDRAVEPRFDGAGEPEGDQYRGRYREQALQQIPQAELLLADMEAHRFDQGDHVGQQADDVQGDDGPHQHGEHPLERRQPGGADQADAQHVKHRANHHQRAQQRDGQGEQADADPLPCHGARRQQQQQSQKGKGDALQSAVTEFPGATLDRLATTQQTFAKQGQQQASGQDQQLPAQIRFVQVSLNFQPRFGEGARFHFKGLRSFSAHRHDGAASCRSSGAPAPDCRAGSAGFPHCAPVPTR